MQRRIVDDKGPGEMGFGGGTDVQVVRRGGVGRQAVENAVVFDVSVVVVVVGEDVELQPSLLRCVICASMPLSWPHSFEISAAAVQEKTGGGAAR